MIFYLFLIISTCIIFFLTFLLWLRARSPSFVAGAGFLYFWSLYGAWFIVYNKSEGASILRYQYLEEKLFPIYLDYNYFLTLLIYSLFIWIVLGALLFFVKRIKIIAQERVLYISHAKLIVISCVASLGSFIIIANDILDAVTSERSIYAVTRFAGNPFFTLHQTLNRVAVLSLAFGLVLYFSGKDSRFIRAKSGKFTFFIYAILSVILFGYLLSLGNKNELFFAAVSCFLLYLANAMKPKLLFLTSLGIISILFFGFIDVVRGFDPQQMLSEMTIGNFLNGFISIATTNEAFGSHFSLYGVLSNDIPLTYGTSISSLLLSLAVPRIIWPDRPADIYQYYAENVGAVPGQGYSIHHVTGWFMNFGIFGVIAGGLLLAGIWAFLFNRSYIANNYKSLFVRVFFIIAPWTFVGYIPSLVRGGLEGYKGLVVDAFIVPSVILYFAAVTKIKR